MEKICWFKEQTIIKGIHARYMKELTEKKIFERDYDVYLQCALYGACLDLRSKKDSGKESKNIFANMFSNDSEYCLSVLRMVLLLDKNSNLSKEEKIKRVFSFDKYGAYKEEKANEMKENISIFNSYFYGGIEDIHSRYFKNCIDDDDIIDKMKRLLEEFNLYTIGFNDKDFLDKISD